MNSKQILSILIICTATGCATANQPQNITELSPTPDPLRYGKTYTLENESVTLTVAPDIGRITHFGFSGERNLLWMNDSAKLTQKKSDGTNWFNWGGDKVWPAQQADWKFIYGGGDWPPKTELDGILFKVIESSAEKLVMESAADSRLHLKLRRTLTLDLNLPKLTIKNELTRSAPSPWPVQIWSVTQCIPPNYTLLEISKNAPDHNTHPFSNLWDSPLPAENAKVTKNMLVFSLSPNLTIAKAGTIGNLCAAVYDDVIFMQQSNAPSDGCYPDGANIEVFSFDRYTELEILSPSRHLQPGENITSVTTWSLIRTTPQASTEDNLKLTDAIL